MPDLMETMYSSQQICIPPSLPGILKKYAKAAIRTQPGDLLKWSTAYFRAMASGIPPPCKERIEYPPVTAPSGLSPGFLKVLINQIGKTETVDKEVLIERWKGVCLNMTALQDLLDVGLFDKEVKWLEFLAICTGTLEPSLTRTMIQLCELLTDEPEGGSAIIPVETFLKLYKFLAKLDCGHVNHFVRKNGQENDAQKQSEAEALKPKEEVLTVQTPNIDWATAVETEETSAEPSTHEEISNNEDHEVIVTDAANDETNAIKEVEVIKEKVEVVNEGQNDEKDYERQDNVVAESTPVGDMEEVVGDGTKDDVDGVNEEQSYVKLSVKVHVAGSQEGALNVSGESSGLTVGDGGDDLSVEEADVTEKNAEGNKKTECVLNAKYGEHGDEEESHVDLVAENQKSDEQSEENLNVEVEQVDNLIDEPIPMDVHDATQDYGVEEQQGEEADIEEVNDNPENENSDERETQDDTEAVSALKTNSIDEGIGGEESDQPGSGKEVIEDNPGQPKLLRELLPFYVIDDDGTLSAPKSEEAEEKLKELGPDESQVSVVTGDGLMVWPDIKVPEPGEVVEPDIFLEKEVNSDEGVEVFSEIIVPEVNVDEAKEKQSDGEPQQVVAQKESIFAPPIESFTELLEAEKSTKDDTEDKGRESVSVMAISVAQLEQKPADDSREVHPEAMSLEVESSEHKLASQRSTEIPLQPQHDEPKPTKDIEIEFLIKKDSDIMLLPSPVTSDVMLYTHNFTGRPVRQVPSSQQLFDNLSMVDVNVSIPHDVTIVEVVEEFRHPKWMDIPGIGPVVPDEVVREVELYFQSMANLQEGMVMPRNIRHFYCPPLEMLPEVEPEITSI